MSREDRLFVLATVCRQRNITPANNLYKAVILKTCAANFPLPKPRVDELTKMLTSAYYADHWHTLLCETPEPEEPLPELKLEPMKQTPRRDYVTLQGMARRDTFDGVGRLRQQEIDLELHKLSSQEIIETWETYNHKDTIIQEGNLYLIYWGGKDAVTEERASHAPIVPPEKPQLFTRLKYHSEDTLEKADFTADKETDGVGEVVEEGEFTEVE
jgi:hypothetical protein